MGSPGFRGCARALAAVSACSLAFACAHAGPGDAPAAPRRPATSPASPASGFAAPSAHATGYDAEAWVADLRALTFELASHYANLEWAASVRKMDLPAAVAKTEARLRDAKGEAEGRRALEQFLEGFGDGHLFVEWDDKEKEKRNEKSETAAKTAGLCARLGYGREPKPGVDFALTGAFEPLVDPDAQTFPGGLLRLANGEKVGTIRIGLFMGEIHPALCVAARAELALADDAGCDDACRESVAMNVMDRMTAALERRVLALAHAGARAIAVDLTRNGGGNDWVEPAARVLTKVPLKAPRMGFIRHEHWAKRFREKLADVQKDRARKDDPVLREAEATLRAAIADAAAPCDLRPLFVAGAPKPGCSQLVTNRIFTSGLLPYAKPGAFEGWASAESLFSTRAFRYHEGTNSLPLVVVVDGGTASASEEFAAMLADNHAALIVGALTTGSGCGFTNGGIPTSLPASGGRVIMPDCARLRADGSNEVSGLVPDVLLPLAGRDSPHQRAAKVYNGLRAVWPRLGKPVSAAAH